MRSIRLEYPSLSNIFCFIRVKLFAKILFLFHISNKNDSFLFLLLIINRFGTHCASRENDKGLYATMKRWRIDP